MTYDVSSLHSLLANTPPYPNTYAGRGIVISGGGSYLPSAYIAIRSLRYHGCTLPIQLWHLGERELPPPLHPLFTAHDVVIVDAFEVQKSHPFKSLSGWQSKPYSIIYSPFKEVFSFDADNLALANPEFLFDHPEYLKRGNIFWPDFKSAHDEYWKIKPEAWRILKLNPQNDAELESGQLLINKERCWRPLLAALHMNENADYFYTHCTYGDKDTYTLAWALCGERPFVIPYRPKLLEEMVRIQFDPKGNDLFQHSRKWVLPSEKNQHLASYKQEDLCRAWLEEFEAGFRNIYSAFGL